MSVSVSTPGKPIYLCPHPALSQMINILPWNGTNVDVVKGGLILSFQGILLTAAFICLPADWLVITLAWCVCRLHHLTFMLPFSPLFIPSFVAGVRHLGGPRHPCGTAGGGPVHCTLRREQPRLPCHPWLRAAATTAGQAAPAPQSVIGAVLSFCRAAPWRQSGHSLRVCWVGNSPSSSSSTPNWSCRRSGTSTPTPTPSAWCAVPFRRSTTPTSWRWRCSASPSSERVQGWPEQPSQWWLPTTASSWPVADHSPAPALSSRGAGHGGGEPVRRALGGGAAGKPGQRPAAGQGGGPAASPALPLPLSQLPRVTHQHGATAGTGPSPGPGPRRLSSHRRHGSVVAGDTRTLGHHAPAAIPRPHQSPVHVLLSRGWRGRTAQRPGWCLWYHGLCWQVLQWPWTWHWRDTHEEPEEAQAVCKFCEFVFCFQVKFCEFVLCFQV